MNETAFKDKLLKHFNRLPSTYFFKVHATSFSVGIPDLIGSLRGRISMGLEAKVYDLPKRDSTVIDLTKDVTPKQRHKMQVMAEGGWDCYIPVLLRPTKAIIWLPWDWDLKMTKAEFDLDLMFHESPRADFPKSIKRLNEILKLPVYQ